MKAITASIGGRRGPHSPLPANVNGTPPIRHRKIRRRLPQDLIGLPQLADLTLQRLDALALLRRRARPLAHVALSLPHPLPERLGRAPDLARDRAYRGPLGGMVAPMVQHHPYRPLP